MQMTIALKIKNEGTFSFILQLSTFLEHTPERSDITHTHLYFGTVTRDWLGGDWLLCKLLAYQKLFLILLSAKHFPTVNQSQLSEAMETLSA